MSRPVHFEIHVDDLDRAKAFYAAAFGWSYEDWSEFAGMPYAGVTTGEEGAPGVNGALMQRESPPPAADGAVKGAALTMGVEDYDETEECILEAGGTVALPNTLCPRWPGRGTTSTPRVMSSASTSPTRTPADTGVLAPGDAGGAGQLPSPRGVMSG